MELDLEMVDDRELAFFWHLLFSFCQENLGILFFSQSKVTWIWILMNGKNRILTWNGILTKILTLSVILSSILSMKNRSMSDFLTYYMCSFCFYSYLYFCFQIYFCSYFYFYSLIYFWILSLSYQDHQLHHHQYVQSLAQICPWDFHLFSLAQLWWVLEIL